MHRAALFFFLVSGTAIVGCDSAGKPTPLPCLAESVSAGRTATWVTKADHSVWRYGMGGGQSAIEINQNRILPATFPAVREDWIPDDTLLLDARSDVICLIGSDHGLRCYQTPGFLAPGEFKDGPGYQDDDVQQVWTGPEDFTRIFQGKSDGSVWAYGGEGSPNAPVTELGNDVASMSVGGLQVCALKQGGSVWCFGPGYVDFPTKPLQPPHQVTLPGPARSIASGLEKSCAVLDDGQVWCWGDATATGGESPTAVDITGVGTLAMGASHTVSVRRIAWLTEATHRRSSLGHEQVPRAQGMAATGRRMGVERRERRQVR